MSDSYPMSYSNPESKGSSGSWVVPLTIVVVVILCTIVGIVIAVHSTQAAPSAAGTAIAKQVEKPVNGANYAAVNTDVRNAVSQVLSAVATDPTAPISSLALTTTTDQEQLVAQGAAPSFTITGTYTPTGYAFQYSSTTGQFAVVNPGTALRTTGASS